MVFLNQLTTSAKLAARTLEAVCARIGKLLGAFTPQECASYFKNAGYNLT
jgi:hypothetical protein